MLRVTEITSLAQIYAYQMGLASPFFFPTGFESWKASFERDIDGEGRRLFRELYGKAAYDDGSLIGFIQYGYTAIGFDGGGALSADLSYPVIRSFYFDAGRDDAGRLLLLEAMKLFEAEKTVYAFFHYFGMSCFARHGKLFAHYTWIQELLHQYGFVVEHENVYYSAEKLDGGGSEIELAAHSLTKGRQQRFDFLLDNRQIGGGEVHDPDANGIAYLRWFYVKDDMQNHGLGSQCLAALKQWLSERGMTRLDTDTASTNPRAQHFYEKNGMIRKGITRSFYLIR